VFGNPALEQDSALDSCFAGFRPRCLSVSPRISSSTMPSTLSIIIDIHQYISIACAVQHVHIFDCQFLCSSYCASLALTLGILCFHSRFLQRVCFHAMQWYKITVVRKLHSAQKHRGLHTKRNPDRKLSRKLGVSKLSCMNPEVPTNGRREPRREPDLEPRPEPQFANRCQHATSDLECHLRQDSGGSPSPNSHPD
jgi:hypothetical protein